MRETAGNVVPRDGIEPPTRGFSILRNYDEKVNDIDAIRGSSTYELSAGYVVDAAAVPARAVTLAGLVLEMAGERAGGAASGGGR